MLSFLSDEQMLKAAKMLAKKFPISYPHTNAQYSTCIRFIYGQFEKQGTLRSNRDFRKMKKEKIEWELSRKFLELLKKQLKKKSKTYGLTILCEMEAHRLGDVAVLNEDLEKLNIMEQMYLEAINYAYKCNSYKHMFSLYYWASQYFKKFGEIDRSIEYSKIALTKSLKYYHKYFPNGDTYYSSRLRDLFLYVENKDSSFCKKIRDKVKYKK